MTNKEIVLRRHPDAFTYKRVGTSDWEIIDPTPSGPGTTIGRGLSEKQAWASAAETVRRSK